ncbi:hypothetical protein A5906_04755 [Bradyrhizobium sacchari]|uniref:Uncharacterized protein n=2 Tax=Bradyrhizobium sacchari TaxID=1399419 RepID=A0A560KMU3_9BRAD|nr:hypothetical protein A5906_04755 [Bradyrhizobium sacchari]TWB67338.1 hypothetical protein FBZ94_1011020 [Bradyrhizobium sacchari]TWB84575.1 hypothetical protein FBZ95_1011020 [Bradyrhizobium sacchari]
MVRCREIGAADLDAVADLLTTGFPKRSREYWIEGLRALLQPFERLVRRLRVHREIKKNLITANVSQLVARVQDLNTKASNCL